MKSVTRFEMNPPYAQDLEQYILSQLPVMAQFQGFREAFYPFYVATALARFFFLLDTHRTRMLDLCWSFIFSQLSFTPIF